MEQLFATWDEVKIFCENCDLTLATPEKGAVIAERMLAFLEDHIKNHFS
jgi:hypothetical protein